VAGTDGTIAVDGKCVMSPEMDASSAVANSTSYSRTGPVLF